MSTIQVLRNGQLTLPARIRSFFGLEKGSLLEAEVEGDRIVLTPVTTVAKSIDKEKEEAKKRVIGLLEKNWRRNKGLSPKDAERMVSEAVAEVRRGEGRK